MTSRQSMPAILKQQRLLVEPAAAIDGEGLFSAVYKKFSDACTLPWYTVLIAHEAALFGIKRLTESFSGHKL